MAEKILGEVIWFDEMKGYGFIEAAGFPNNVFLHATNLAAAGIPSSKLKKGTKVRFNMGRPPKPKGANDKCAVDIELAA